MAYTTIVLRFSHFRFQNLILKLKPKDASVYEKIGKHNTRKPAILFLIKYFLLSQITKLRFNKHELLLFPTNTLLFSTHFDTPTMMHEYATQESVNLSPRPENPMATTLFSVPSTPSSPSNNPCSNNNSNSNGNDISGSSLEYSGTSATEHLTLSEDYDGDEEDNTTLGSITSSGNDSTASDHPRLGIANVDIVTQHRCALWSPFPQSSLHNYSTADYHTIVLTPPAPPKSVLVAPKSTTTNGIDISPITTKHGHENRGVAVLPTLPDLGRRMNRLAIFPEDRQNNKTVTFASPMYDDSSKLIPSMITTTAMTPTTSPMVAMTPFQHPLTRREQRGLLTPGFYQTATNMFVTPHNFEGDKYRDSSHENGVSYKGVSVPPTPPSSPVAGAFAQSPLRPVYQEWETPKSSFVVKEKRSDDVPQAWLDLYHNRPSLSADDKSHTLVWMRQVLAMRTEEPEDDHDVNNSGAFLSPSPTIRSTPKSKECGSKCGPVDTPVLKALLK